MSTVVKDLGAVSAYAYAVEKGYTGTEAEFAELMADYAEVGQRAEDAADSALESKTAAQTAATTATNKATEATTAATTATTKAGEASTSASTATSAKDTAVSASQTATTKATEATTAAATATSAKTDAVAANTAAQSAKTVAQTAQTGAETAAASVQSSAAQIQTNAEDISQLKSEITDKSDTADMLKSFPTDTASGAVASFADGANVPVKSLIVDINPVQSGSGDPSPTNVRPISGWDAVNANVSGINIWDEEVESGYIDPVTGAEVTDANKIRMKNYVPVLPNMTLYKKTPIAFWVVYFDADKEYIGHGDAGGNRTITMPDNCYYIRCGFEITYGTTYNHDISINYPSTDHEYHAYSGQSINIALGQTVYGGKLDVTNGVLTVTHLIATLGDFDWSYVADWNGYPCFYTDSVSGGAGDLNNINTLSSSYKAVSFSDLYSALRASTSIVAFNNLNRFYVRDSRYSDVSSFKTAMSTTQLMYPIATPLTITLDSHEIDALYGSNNVWADTGDSAVEYRADPKLYIQRLTEPDADMVADSNITSGQYFMVGNTLYKATANIASGATISPNVNCTRKSLSEALNELNV